MPKDSDNGVEEANTFLDHVRTTYPETADHWQVLNSEEEFLDILDDEDYASSRGGAGFSFGVVFSSGSPEFEYKVWSILYVGAPQRLAGRYSITVYSA